MFLSLARLGVWSLLAISIVVVGWDEPLLYKFKTVENVRKEERSRFGVRTFPLGAPSIPAEFEYRWQRPAGEPNVSR